MSKRKVRSEIIGFWFNQYKQGVSTADAIQANIDYSGYFLYKKEVEKLFEDTANLEEIHVQPEDADGFAQFLDEFNLIKTPKYSRGGGGTQARLNSADVAEKKGVTEANIPLYIEAMTTLLEQKKVVDSYLPDGMRVAVSIPNKKKVESDGVEPGGAQSPE